MWDLGVLASWRTTRQPVGPWKLDVPHVLSSQHTWWYNCSRFTIKYLESQQVLISQRSSSAGNLITFWSSSLHHFLSLPSNMISLKVSQHRLDECTVRTTSWACAVGSFLSAAMYACLLILLLVIANTHSSVTSWDNPKGKQPKELPHERPWGGIGLRS